VHRTRPSKDGAHNIMTLIDFIEIGGSLLILAAFAAAQLGRLDVRSVRYLVLNIAGAGVLAVVAAAHASWGFLLLEGTWTIVSALSLLSVLRQSRQSARGRGTPSAT
jgi:hypothetical protein